MAYNGDYEDGTTDDDYTNEDLLQLNRLCAAAFPPPNKTDDAKYQSEMSWEPVREWINSHSKEEIQQAAVQLGDSNMTALHFACRNGSPNDVIDTLISVAHEAVEWPDSFGWLPIHYACACGADAEVIKKLAETFPDSKTSVDRRGRTPLHFALGNQNPDQLASPAVVSILSSSGAAAVADEQGMLVSSFSCATFPTCFHLIRSIDKLTDAYACDYFLPIVYLIAPSLRVCIRSIRGGTHGPH
jgi:hypothetical protein